ncbi:hypothetical protein LTR41_010974 [Exophiala xenobiotica]|nr:hypothetical protein LTR41_010974 [Exophiala xenobiotica]
MPESYQHPQDPHGGYLSYRRASKACQSCRERKIRCDVTLRGVPCNNCRNSEVSCRVLKCRRGKKYKEWHSKANAAAVRSRPSPRHVSMEVLLQGAGSISSMAHVERPSIGSNRNPPSHRSVVQSNCDDFISLSIATLRDLLGVDLVDHSVAPMDPPETDTSTEDFPPYFRPCPTHLEDTDVEYARNKGAFCVPHGRFRNEIIRSYLAYVHWYLPIVNTDDLLQLVDGEATELATCGYSLLLFQCVMFAAVGFVNEETVKEANYKNSRSVRKVSTTEPNVVLVQCLLLLSLWSERPDGNKEAWYWAGIAICVAQTNGLHRNPDDLQVSPTVKRLRKRVFWCCFLRDRLMSLAIGRPMRIRDDEFDVPPLTLQDFETEIAFHQPNVLQDGQRARDGHIPWDGTTAEQLAEIVMAKIKLCTTVGTIISTQYSMLEKSTRFSKGAAGSFSSVMLFPSPSRPSRMTNDDEDGSLQRFEAELAAWHHALPRPLQLPQLQTYSGAARKGHLVVSIGQALKEDQQSEPRQCMLLQCALLHMLYHGAVSILHRPWSNLAPSRAKISAAAIEMANIFTFLNAQGLTSFLPTNVIPMLMASITSNAVLIQSTVHKVGTGGDSMEQNLRDVERARDHVSELLVSLTYRKVYISSDSVWAFVEAFLARLGLRIIDSARPGRDKTILKSNQRAFEIKFIPNSTNVYHPGVAVPGDNYQLPKHNDGVGSVAEISTPHDLASMQSGANLHGDTPLFDMWTTSGDVEACHSTDTDVTTWDSLFDNLDYNSSVPPQNAAGWDVVNWSETDWETVDLDWHF